jgi:hypothetical protein
MVFGLLFPGLAQVQDGAQTLSARLQVWQLMGGYGTFRIQAAA